MKHKKWIVIFSLLLLLCFFIFWGQRHFSPAPAVAYISVNGEVISTVELTVSEPYEFDVKSKNGSFNRIRVENGKICVVDAGCPDRLCVKQGYAAGGIPIVCLPNKLSVSVGGKIGADAVTGGGLR